MCVAAALTFSSFLADAQASDSSANALNIAEFVLDENACAVINKIVNRGFADLDAGQWAAVERSGCTIKDESGIRSSNTVSINEDDPRLTIEMGYCINDLVRRAETDWDKDELSRWDIARTTGNLKEEEDDLRCITAINLRGGYLPYSWASHIKISFRDFPNRTPSSCKACITKMNADGSYECDRSASYADQESALETDQEQVDKGLNSQGEGFYSQSGNGGTKTSNAYESAPQPCNSVVHRVDWWIHWQNQDQWRLLARSRVIRDFFERYETPLSAKSSKGKKLFKLRACNAVAGRAKTQLVYQGPAPKNEQFDRDHAEHVKNGIDCSCEAHYKDQYLVFTVSQQPDASVTLWKGPTYERAWESQRNRYVAEQLDKEILEEHLASDIFGPNYGRYDSKPDNSKIINHSKAQAPSSVRPYVGGEACREVLKFSRYQKNYYRDTKPKKGPLLPNL